MPLPESPYWLPPGPKRNKSLRWLYPQFEIYKSQSTQFKIQKPIEENQESFLETCKKPTVYRPALLLTCLFAIQQFSGAYVVIFYSVDIFKEIGASYEDILVVLFGSIRLVMAIVSFFLSRIVGRRTLLFISSSGMCFSCFLVFLLRHLCASPEIVSAFILVYVCFGALGVLGIPWTLIGELFPVRVKGAASGFMITVSYVIMFSLVKMFPFLKQVLDLKYIFLMFSIDAVLAVIVVYLWLPETFRVSFSEIEKHFNR